MACYRQKTGDTEIPFFGCMPQRHNSRKELAGFTNQVMMGSIAGIGFIGKNGLLVNDQFVSRIMLVAVPTNADLPVFANSPCKMNSCPSGCTICADICPVKAIVPEDKKVKIMKCLYFLSTVPNKSIGHISAITLFNLQYTASRNINRNKSQ
ncbi:MAG: hypothetical protein EHM28_10420 [Spirochaetaceae bacterium]|nr:MAG: hypothetical protein EHM28_10420 [Spirochaetaceae bacterium]